MHALDQDASGHVDFEKYAMDAEAGVQLPLVRVVDDFGALYDYVTNDGPRMLLRTNKDAPRNKLVSTDVSAEPVEWQASGDVGNGSGGC